MENTWSVRIFISQCYIWRLKPFSICYFLTYCIFVYYATILIESHFASMLRNPIPIYICIYRNIDLIFSFSPSLTQYSMHLYIYFHNHLFLPSFFWIEKSIQVVLRNMQPNISLECIQINRNHFHFLRFQCSILYLWRENFLVYNFNFPLNIAV